MSYNKFRYIAGIDGKINFDEYLEYTRQEYPHLDYGPVYKIAREKFALMDRNGSGRIEYHEFVDAEMRNRPPGSYYPPRTPPSTPNYPFPDNGYFPSHNNPPYHGNYYQPNNHPSSSGYNTNNFQYHSSNNYYSSQYNSQPYYKSSSSYNNSPPPPYYH